MQLVNLSPNHAADAARLHIAGQPGTFLTTLGPGLLTVLYRSLPQSQRGFGFVALPMSTAPATVPATVFRAATPLGFIAATTSTSRLFVELGTRHFHHFFPPLLWRFVQKPTLLYQLLQTLIYPFLQHAHRDKRDVSSKQAKNNAGDYHSLGGEAAELLAIMVAPGSQGQGVGTALLVNLVRECRRRQLAALDVTVDAHNMGARRFYERHGFVEQYTFTLYGRVMCSYRLHDFMVE